MNKLRFGAFVRVGKVLFTFIGDIEVAQEVSSTNTKRIALSFNDFFIFDWIIL